MFFELPSSHIISWFVKRSPKVAIKKQSTILLGFIIFYSASLGLGVRENIEFSKILFSQIFFGVIGGGVLMFITAKIPSSFWNTYALHIFILSLAATFLVFVPGLGIMHGGARRWISIGEFTLQPAEFLKIGSILLFASWIAVAKNKIRTIKLGLIPCITIIILVAGSLLLQKDTGTTVVILSALIGMYFLGGAKLGHVGLVILICILGITTLYFVHPYIRSRVDVFLHPNNDPQGASYQIQQSLIAVGAGGIYGKGFGQSIQKFGFLPEPMGDSIFAVFSEEWGFLGAVVLISLFMLLTFRGFKIAFNNKDIFTFSMVSGIMLLVIAQSFVNIGAMIGIVPLTGMPLIFVSKGGTALLIALGSMGIVLGASRGMNG